MFAPGLAFIGVLWLVGAPGFSPLDASLRRDSLKVPLVTTALALVAVTVLAAWTSRRSGLVIHLSRGAVGCQLANAAPQPQERNGEVETSYLMPRDWTGSLPATLLLLETVFLVASGAPLWSSSGRGVPSSPAVTALLRTDRQFDSRFRQLHLLRRTGGDGPRHPS
jgi:hypothetical protein